jgi:hypothetical protein
MRNVIDDNCNMDTAILGDHMTKQLRSAPHDATIYQLLDIFLGKRFRHFLLKKMENIGYSFNGRCNQSQFK